MPILTKEEEEERKLVGFEAARLSQHARMQMEYVRMLSTVRHADSTLASYTEILENLKKAKALREAAEKVFGLLGPA